MIVTDWVGLFAILILSGFFLYAGFQAGEANKRLAACEELLP